MKRKLSLVTLVGMSLVITACNQDNQPVSTETPSTNIQSSSKLTAEQAKIELANKKYQLIQYNDEQIPAEFNFTLQFDDKLALTGNMCNQFLGGSQFDGDKLKAQLAMTLMFCGNELENKLDQIIGNLLQNGANLEISDKMLTLSNETLGQKLTYKLVGEIDNKPASSKKSDMITKEDLMHHQYKLIKFNNTPVTNEEKVLLSFGENMTISGNMCNAFNGNVTLENNVISSKGLAMTRMFCAEPLLNQLDGVISTMLSEGANIELKGNILILKNKDNVLEYQLDDLM